MAITLTDAQQRGTHTVEDNLVCVIDGHANLVRSFHEHVDLVQAR
jgi:hypothetical protein